MKNWSDRKYRESLRITQKDQDGGHVIQFNESRRHLQLLFMKVMIVMGMMIMTKMMMVLTTTKIYLQDTFQKK